MGRWLAVLLAIPLSASAEQEPPFTVESAYHEGTAIAFTPSFEFDWASLAPAELRDLSVPNQDPAVIARYAPDMDMFGTVEVQTAIATPIELTRGAVHYLVDDGGVTALALDSTRLVTRLEFDPQGTRIEQKSSWGRIFGTGTGPADGGGFVLRASGPLDVRAAPSNLTADELLLGRDFVEQVPDGYFARGTPFWEIVAQHRFTVEGAEGAWVFVQWAADRDMVEAGCEYRYDLFRFGGDGSVAREAWTAYGCDV